MLDKTNFNEDIAYIQAQYVMVVILLLYVYLYNTTQAEQKQMSLYYILKHRIRSPTELTVFLRKYVFLQTVNVSFMLYFHSICSKLSVKITNIF